jgi:hypothetical protein
MFDVLDTETTAPPAMQPAQAWPSTRDVQDRIMAIARRMRKLDEFELADIDRRRHLGLPLHAGVVAAPTMAMTHAALAEPAERDSVENDEDATEHEHDTLTANQPAPADADGLFDWLPAP